MGFWCEFGVERVWISGGLEDWEIGGLEDYDAGGWIGGYALENKLVDVKVCAVNEVWSGLKLVIPVKFRESL